MKHEAEAITKSAIRRFGIFFWGADLSLLSQIQFELGWRQRFYGIVIPGTEWGFGIVRRLRPAQVVSPDNALVNADLSGATRRRR